MTFAELKRLYQKSNPKGHYFDSDTMRFFGDTSGNYGVRASTQTFDGRIAAWELYRRKAVKCGVKTSTFFDVDGRIVS